jgi:hypothetical protein
MSTGERAYRGVVVLGVTLAVVNVILWFLTPALREAVVDARAGGLPTRDWPQIMTGVQELLVYFDPWLARWVFPFVYTLGLAAIPLLRRPAANRPGSGPGLAFPFLVAALLVAFEAVWLFLTAVGVFLRGPNWNLFWPDEPWDPHRVVPLNNVNLSDYFWQGKAAPGMPWYVRELPGLVTLAVYFLAGIAHAWLLFRRTGRTTPFWRWVALLMLIQLAALVPMKMLFRWVFALKYWVFVPEYSVNV